MEAKQTPLIDLRAALAQQAEPTVTEDMKSAVRWAPSSAYWSQRLREFFGPDAREGIDALERRLAKAQQAEPLNLRDPAVQKRLASQWGYVPAAAQAEPVEPLYTARPGATMVPLTEEEIKTAFHAARNAKLGASQDNSRHRLSVIEIARAIEKTVWEKHHG